MTIGVNSIPSNYCKIGAGTHPYDRTIRPQFVSKNQNPEYHDLISNYYKISGAPALLNTSFYLHGEPIVNNIADSVRTFVNSELDNLLIGKKYLLSKIW